MRSRPRAVAIGGDIRGRVPFALLGVLLLASSLTLAPTLGRDPVPSETAVERAIERTTAETQTAVRDGVSVASQRAAANPVVEPANTSAGRVLNASSPFRDALRIRIYLQVRDRLEQLSYTSEDVTVTASVPPTPNASALRTAKRRVEIAPTGANRTALRATVENVTLRVRRDGTVVSTRAISPTVVVPTPVLMLHEQVETYETRANNGLTRPGLSQRLTARLYPIAWARGYAQYGGAPIENVVANRHVSLATNGALLGVQRTTFGRSDPEGRAALTEATAVTGVKDLVYGSNDTAVASQILDHTAYRPPRDAIGTGDTREQSPRADDRMRIGINGTADTAFREIAAPGTLDETIREAYAVEVRLIVAKTHLGGGRPSRPDSPGANWTLVDDDTDRGLAVVGKTGGIERSPDDWHTLDRFGRIVQREYTRTATWTNGRDFRKTTERSTERWRVRVGILGRHESDSPAPDRPIETAHQRGIGPLAGPNLADVASKAERRLVSDAGGRGGVAERAVRRSVDTRPTTVYADRPPGVRAWVYRDLADLRERVRNTSITVERGSVGSFETNPSRKLRDRLDERRSRFESAPQTYNYTAQKARTAARIAYLDAVDARLSDRSDHRTRMRDDVDTELGDRTGGSLVELRRGLTARETQVPRARPPPTGPAGPVRTRVDASPQYLTLAEIDEKHHPPVDESEHPLVARNVNVFTVPYGDAASVVTEGAIATADRVRLSTAAVTLEATTQTARNTSNATLRSRRETLQSRVTEANAHIERELVRTVRIETDASPRASRQIVSAAMANATTPAARSTAFSNGSAANWIAKEAGRRRGLSMVERDWLRLQLDATANRVLQQPRARPRSKLVEKTGSVARAVAKSELQRTIADAGRRRAERVAERRLGTTKLPAGLPLAPPLTPWYATTNIWWVTVEGEYARFAVTARHGTPAMPGASITYARDGDVVRVDVDEDGTAETLGTATRVSVRAETGVVVVVPPRPRGVGDKDGNAIEESAGWPDAGT